MNKVKDNELNSLKSMKQLLEFPPYLKVINEIELRIKDLDEEIINTMGEGEKKYSLMDLKRVERMILRQFTELPDNLIKSFDNIVEGYEEV